MNLPDPAINIGPSADLNEWNSWFVGVPYWLWSDVPTSGRVVETEQGITITLEHGAPELEWDMGDGTVLQCGVGTPWVTPPVGELPESPTCGHRYEVPGSYAVSVTATWTVHWTGLGFSGSFPVSRSSTSDPMEVGELHSLLVEPK